MGPDQATRSYIQNIKKRRRLSQVEKDVLVSSFLLNPKPAIHERQQLARQLSMSPRAVQIWFQNRRSKYSKNGYDSVSPDLNYFEVKEESQMKALEYTKTLEENLVQPQKRNKPVHRRYFMRKNTLNTRQGISLEEAFLQGDILTRRI